MDRRKASLTSDTCSIATKLLGVVYAVVLKRYDVTKSENSSILLDEGTDSISTTTGTSTAALMASVNEEMND